MKVEVKKKNNYVIKFEDLKVGDVFTYEENETDKFDIYIKIDNTEGDSRSLRLGDFKTCWTSFNTDCYLINSTLTLYNE